MNSLLENIHKELIAKQPGFEQIVANLLDNYGRHCTDWQQYQFFAPCKYARNLVEINDEFEAIVLCWDDNQESPIHNHTLQNCWLVVLEGSVEEIQYDMNEMSHKLIQTQSTTLVKGQSGYIRDDIALHKVRSVNGKACTLHIYNKPIPYCNIYDPVTGEFTVRKCGFFTLKGMKQSPEMTALYLHIYEMREACLAKDEEERNAALKQVDEGSLYSTQSILSLVSEGGSGKEEFSAW